MTRRADAILVLEDGRTFHGEAYGAVGETFGEAIFTTGMTGYQEALTDPSYHRQIVTMTAPHIGNTGVNARDNESDRIWVSGLVVRQPAHVASNWQSEGELEDELSGQGIVGICQVDTRALTRHLREHGAMRAGISSRDTDAESLLAKVTGSPRMSGSELVSEVTTGQPYVVESIGAKRYTVVALDLGVKRNTPRRMAHRGIETHVLPAGSSFEDVLTVQPDAVFLSNGPGDPATATAQVELTRRLLAEKIPVFGICFGNQILGRALGLETFKLKYGHHGLNQPVIDLTTGKVEITAHNHGFALKPAGLSPRTGTDGRPVFTPFDTEFGRAQVTHICLNDNVVEGVRGLDFPAFSVQYHPEAAAGPRDADYLFDRLVELIEGATTKAGNSA
ncbi:MAG TPA: glutamine-hydrolyzing carbamoyl-phosphate synthase small subunit [Candidatus Stackebrandtia excrementipullorum]|nr:glutamine-hydrolyzing carbamoyl-phosphate synthase small subunit [Candidatus Stackebrandtia excrementipullorum]